MKHREFIQVTIHVEDEKSRKLYERGIRPDVPYKIYITAPYGRCIKLCTSPETAV